MMGVKIVLAEREPIALALNRFRKALEHHPASWKWYKRYGWRVDFHFIKPTQIRRYKRWRKKFKAQLATLLAQRAGEQ